MSRFVEAPAQLSISRLKSDLVAHNVALPPAKSKKVVYVELHLQHIDLKNAADFSSDEEDQVQDVADEEEYTEMPDPSGLTDDELKAALLEHGFKAGPIVETTRALYEKKLRKLLQSNGRGCLNGVEKGVLYSDDEEEEEEDKELGSEEEEEEEKTVKESDQAQQGSSQVELCFQNGGFVYPQCFLPSSRLQAHASRNSEPSPKWNSGNAVQSSEQSRPRCSQISVGISRASSVDQHSGLGSGLPQEPVKDTIKNMFPNTDAMTPGIYATRRRPIKGAAGRPVQYAYPVTPVSPMTLEKREVERRLVPIQIQILVFLIVTCLLYFIYVCVEDNSFSSAVALLDSLYQQSDSQEGLLLQAETQDVPALSGQD
ncbi:LEM domain-containing protein 1 isoform X3 [Etheostoma spectabile]|uniref:LEM domain-containing protein 1 isoform X3 n=1 Tax=Etheostoma spectabile TaxID=54343 RepID=UPI0013AE9C22|nr:lamina-associated polypeptide 2, isoforms beta/gamma-like isoform X3 [Etheostoma spectabile]